jgi:predicted MPP superfamily phosphohydrolase
VSSPFRKKLKILVERFKLPRNLVRFGLHLTGLYKQGLRNAHDVRLQQFEVNFENLPPGFDGYRLLMLSDLHIDSELHITPKVKQFLRHTPADALVLLGDYRYRLDGPYDVVLKRIRQIADSAQTQDGIFAVRGNHDSKKLMAEFPAMGVRVLNNESVELKRGRDSIFLLGVDEPHYDKEDDLPRATKAVPPEVFTILLAHTAEIYKKAQALEIDFYLCGHTHGGQICLKNQRPIITNVKAPRRMARGFWTYKNMTGYTSTGVGTSSVPVRYNCPPEIVLFTLRTKNAAH